VAVQEIEVPREAPRKEASVDVLARARYDFAERCFVNALELSRFMDQKASYLLSAVALLTAALGIVASKALDARTELDWQWTIKAIGMVGFVGYLALAFAVIYNSTRVFRAHSSLLNRRSSSPGLIFPLAVLSQFNAADPTQEERYAERLSGVSLKEMAHDYANQIIEVSTIYERKQHYINLSLRLFHLLTIFWGITMICLLAIIVIR
jgi:hypothetical protein